jgi:murein DD-endopeptidase MepM/ murein hydrolase activator NlpD
VVRALPAARPRRRRLEATTALVGLLLAARVASPPASNASDQAHGPQSGPSTASSAGGAGSNVDDISTELIRAQSRLEAARGDLAAAQSRLSVLHSQVLASKQLDTRMQIRLGRAVVRLHDARTDITQSRTDVADTRATLTGYAVSAYSSGGVDASMLSMALSSGTAEQLVNGMQDVDAVLNAEAVSLEKLQAQQTLLTLTEQRVNITKHAVSRQRTQARDNLVRSRGLEAGAIVTERAIAARVVDLQADQERLASAKTTELARISTQSGTIIHPNPGYLSYPVSNPYITSPYGMRMHPILHVWKLHDGTDFSAACGTPVHAAAEGTITEEYFNAGYGNRVMMDNGHVDGIDLGTSYNHLSSFVASVGQHVARGQLIAYSGTTGYSTGCHLHFMVYVGIATVDPMTWL